MTTAAATLTGKAPECMLRNMDAPPLPVLSRASQVQVTFERHLQRAAPGDKRHPQLEESSRRRSPALTHQCLQKLAGLNWIQPSRLKRNCMLKWASMYLLGVARRLN